LRFKAFAEYREGDAVRVRDQKGSWIPATYVDEHTAPRSHIVKAGPQGRNYRRNRSLIMRTRERPHVITPRPVNRPVARPLNGTVVRKEPVNVELPPVPPHEPEQLQPPTPPTVKTRSGRTVNRPGWMRDFE
jgi:hypothetical protein